MIVHKEQFAGIPTLHAFAEGMDESTPVIIFLHGHLSASEHNLHYAYQWVKQGVRVLMPDAIFHGERHDGESEKERSLKFWDIVFQSVKEVGQIYNEGVKRGLFTGEKVGVAGTSMGGITTSACLTQYDWIQTAGICMGVTSVKKLALHQLGSVKIDGAALPLTDEMKQQMLVYLEQFDLEEKKALFTTTPVIFWHGKNDPIIPFELAYDFYAEHLQQTKAEFIREENAAHAVSREGMLKVTSFLAQHLA